MRVMSLIGGAGGGNGVGGDMKVGSSVISGFRDDCSLTLTDSTLVGNQAVGGAGGSGNCCGAGQGGGPRGLGGELRLDQFHIHRAQRCAGWPRRHGRYQRPGPGRWRLHRHHRRLDARHVDTGPPQLRVDQSRQHFRDLHPELSMAHWRQQLPGRGRRHLHCFIGRCLPGSLHHRHQQHGLDWYQHDHVEHR
jgi:hypothetical protein